MTRGQYLALGLALTASLLAMVLAVEALKRVAAMRTGVPLKPSTTVLM